MGKLFNKSENHSDEKGSNAVVLTPAMFFGRTGKFKYADPSDFLAVGESLRDSDESELSHFFDLVKEGLRMVVNRKKRVDRGGMPYKYENFLRNKGTEGVKVVLFGQLDQFINDYVNGLIITNFSLNELIEEARKA